MKYFTFRMPVKRHISKYLTSKFGDIILAEMDTDIGFVILNTLASRLDSKVCRGYNNQFKDPYKSEVTFTLPYHYFYLTKKEISLQTVILLNRYFENKFEEELQLHVSYHDIEGYGKYKTALESFADKYAIEIEEDISFEALKKMEYRCRKKNPENSLRRLSSSSGLFGQRVA